MSLRLLFAVILFAAILLCSLMREALILTSRSMFGAYSMTVAQPSKMLLINPATLDIGIVPAVHNFSSSIQLTNISGCPITIEDISWSCGCVEATVSSGRELSTNASMDLSVVIDLTSRAMVTTADAARSTIEFSEAVILTLRQNDLQWLQSIELCGRVKPVVSADSKAITLGRWIRGTSLPPEKQFALKWFNPTDIRQVTIESIPEWIAAEVTGIHPANEGECSTSLTLRVLPTAAPGYYHSTLMVAVELDSTSRLVHIPLQVHGQVLSPVTVMPAQLQFGRLSVGTVQSVTLTFGCRETGHECNIDDFRVVGIASETVQITRRGASSSDNGGVVLTLTVAAIGNQVGYAEFSGIANGKRYDISVPISYYGTQ